MTVPLLSPEMMARAIVSEPDWWQPGPEFLIDFDKLREHIAHAIAFDRGYTRAAEREECAKIADGFIPSSFRDGGIKRHEGQTYHKLPLRDLIGIARDDRARTIAYAIRARGVARSTQEIPPKEADSPSGQK